MKMKKITMAIGVALALSSSTAVASKWVDDWFDNAVYDSPDSFSSQKRGYYTAGGFSARVKSTTEYPVTISMPKLSAGCGGIDAFLGGFSFLDADYIVEKLQGMIQAAPYVAFQMALKTMSKELASTIEVAESIIDWLNGIQLNECAMAKPVVTAALDQDPSALKGLWTEITGDKSLKETTSRLWTENVEKIKSNDNKPTEDLKTTLSGCPAEVKDLFKHGSVIDNITDKMGVKEYAPILRGYIGDVTIKAAASDKIPVGRRISACVENNGASVDDFLYGRIYVKNAANTCSAHNGKAVIDIVETKMNAITSKIKAAGALSSEEVRFINATPNLPVYSILRQSVLNHTEAATVSTMSELVSLYYTYLIMNDLYKMARQVNFRVQEALTDPGGSASGDSCRLELFANTISKFDDMQELANQYQTLMRDNYNTRVRQTYQAMALSQSFQQHEQQYLKDKATEVGKTSL
jgi:conjugative transfer pilus assembly protein TraH